MTEFTPLEQDHRVRIAEMLLDNIKKNKKTLFELSRRSTGNTSAETDSDYQASIAFLKTFISSDGTVPKNIKPKGDILIILSFNEPLLLSIVPVFSALITGNAVVLKPSSKNIKLMNMVWSKNIIDLLNLKIININVENLEDHIKTKQAVYFFGSHIHSKNVYSLCAKHHVEYYPEIEAADVKVIYASSEGINVSEDIMNTINNAWSHSGKMCQRISGVYINRGTYSAYANKLKEYLLADGFADVENLDSDEQLPIHDIMESKPTTILQKNDEVVVFNPAEKSTFVESAYFAKTLWIRKYDKIESLVQILNERKYFLGLNIYSEDKDVQEALIQKTRFSRYTLGAQHCAIANDSGWGGNWPTGSGGYKTWIDVFSNKFTVIDSRYR